MHSPIQVFIPSVLAGMFQTRKQSMKKFLIAFAMVFVLAGCSTTTSDPLPTASQTDVTSETLEASSLAGLNVDTYNIGASDHWDTIEAVRMTTTNKADAVSITIANTVNEYIANRIEEFQKQVTENKKTDYDAKFVKEFYMVHDESTVSKNIYAITLTDDSYRGMAHNTSRTETFAFDKRTGERINFQEQIDPNKLREFDQFVYETLKEQATEPIFNKSEILKTLSEENQYFAWFGSKTEGLAIIFNEYAVGPYSSGQIAIGVGWNDVKDFLKPDSIFISEFVK